VPVTAAGACIKDGASSTPGRAARASSPTARVGANEAGDLPIPGQRARSRREPSGAIGELLPVLRGAGADEISARRSSGSRPRTRRRRPPPRGTRARGVGVEVELGGAASEAPRAGPAAEIRAARGASPARCCGRRRQARARGPAGAYLGSRPAADRFQAERQAGDGARRPRGARARRLRRARATSDPGRG
jgi:hypothetical protein